MKPRTQYSRALLFYVRGVTLAALLALFTLPAAGLINELACFSALLFLAAMAGACPIRISKLRVELVPTHPFVLVTLAVLGPLAAALVGIASVVGAAIGRTPKPPSIRLTFNIGNVALSSTAAAWAFLWMGGYPGQTFAGMIFPMAAAMSAYYLVNMGLVALAIKLEKHQGFVATWKMSLAWMLGPYLAGVALALLASALLSSNHWWGLALIIPGGWLLLYGYSVYSAKRVSRRTVGTPATSAEAL